MRALAIFVTFAIGLISGMVIDLPDTREDIVKKDIVKEEKVEIRRRL